MPNVRSAPPPDEDEGSLELRSMIRRQFEDLEETLEGAAALDPEYVDWAGDLHRAAWTIHRAVIRQRERARAGRSSHKARAVSARDVVSRSIRTLREASGHTQTELAQAMNLVGFVGWKRSTVAEIEGKTRWPSIEELMALAALFGCPVGSILSALDDGEVLTINERRIATPLEAREFCMGRDAGGEEEPYGVLLDPVPSARRFVYRTEIHGEDDDRPAVKVRSRATSGVLPFDRGAWQDQ